MVTASPAMAAVLAFVKRAAAANARILITGESGVGKDRLAREIHLHSNRRSGPFVALNCAGLTETLLESELFGHVRGSFTDAHGDHAGKLRQADRGTLFLDEVGEMSPRMQGLLLRFLDDGMVQAVGSDALPTHVNVRVVAATNRDLSEMVTAGTFREDLLHRLRVVHIHIPPLRTRREDIRPLIAHFTAAASRPLAFSEEALRLLEQYSWPGNVRELQNLVEQALWLMPGPIVQADDLPRAIRAAGNPVVRERRHQLADDLYEGLISGTCSFWTDVHAVYLARDITRHDVRALVARALQAANGNYRLAIRLFGIPDHQYDRFMKFLAKQDCKVDFHAYRAAKAPERTRYALPAPSQPTPDVGADAATPSAPACRDNVTPFVNRKKL